ncbi:MAG: hypothetical protein BVN35_16510 [Proteobacteria bacterium ST_bin11]|nr:MAG: hypothetical protein BVN35_16510 [Proteobacteria bacterium ST_bin11]
MRRVAEGAGNAFRQRRSKARSAGNKRQPGGIFFGYFILAKQKKVSRLSVRKPTLNPPVALATQDTKAYLPRGYKNHVPLPD